MPNMHAGESAGRLSLCMAGLLPRPRGPDGASAARARRCMTTVSTLAAAVMTPALTGLLVGTLVPVDTLGLLTSTLQARLL